MPQLADPLQSGDNTDIDEHLRNFSDGDEPTNVRRPSTGPDPEFLDNGAGQTAAGSQAGGRELPVSPSSAHGGDTHGGGRGARRAAARDDHNTNGGGSAGNGGRSGKPKPAEKHTGGAGGSSGKGFDPKSAAINKAADKLPGGKKDADGNLVEKGGAEKAVDKAAGAAVTGLTGSAQAGQLTEKVGVRRITKAAAIGVVIMLTPVIIIFMIFTYVATHPWDAAKQVLTNSSIRRFALNAAKQAGTGAAKTIVDKLSYETDYKPGSAIAASGQRPEAGTLLDTISKIDFEKSKNRYKQANCPYDVVTKKVVAFDGKQRSVIAKVVDKSGNTADISDVKVFDCVLQHYPVVETMMRSPEARKINKQMNVNLSYAEKKDSDVIKGKSTAEVKKALHKKTTDRVWRNAKDPAGLLYPDNCQENYKPTGDKADKAIKKIANDLLCGKKPEEITIDYPVDNLPDDLRKATQKQLTDNAESICIFYEKLNKNEVDPDADKRQRADRAKSSARAGLEALTLADTGIAGDIQTAELNNDFYKLSSFASSRAYNQEVNGTTTGKAMDPEALPSTQVGLTKAMTDELYSQGLLSLPNECKLFKKSPKDHALQIVGLGIILRARLAKESPDAFNVPLNPSTGLANFVSTSDLIVRTVRLVSNVSNSGAEEGPDNFNRMTVGAKNTMYAYTASLLGGTYQNDAEANQDSLTLETIKRNEDKNTTMLARLFNTKNPRSVASRIAAGSTATPKQITQNATRYAINLLNPIKAFADLNTELAYVGYGESSKAMAATDDDRAYWKIDTTGTDSAKSVNILSNAQEIEAMKKRGQNSDKFAAWDKCLETYYPDKQAVLDQNDPNCKEVYLGGPDLTLARKYAIYKGNMNFYGAWAKASSEEQDDSIYAKGENSGAFTGGAVGGDAGGNTPQSDPGADTSATPCPTVAGIADAGVAQTYGPGKVPKNKIHLCNVQGIIVNVSVASNLNNMVNAAKKDGLTLSGGGFRTYDKQKELRRTNGCPADDNASPSSCRVPTARPGNSNHEQGEAVDFNNSHTRSTAVYSWLSKNAAAYSFFNLPSEAWHWSRNGR